MSLHSPVPTPIHPPSWRRPAGNLEYQETRDLAEHRRVTPGGLGCDFSNGWQGAPIYAMHPGIVEGPYVQNTPGEIGHGSLICRINGAGETSGYAHAQSFLVRNGQRVKAGQQIGVVGATGQGISGPHLHTDYQKPPGRYHEILTLIEGDDVSTYIYAPPFLGADGKPAPRAVSFAPGTYTAYRPDGSKKSYAIASASSAPAVAECTIIQIPDKDPHGPGWLQITAGVFKDWYIRKGPGITVAPDPPSGGGYTQKDLDAAYNEGRGAVQGAAAAVPPK